MKSNAVGPVVIALLSTGAVALAQGLTASGSSSTAAASSGEAPRAVIRPARNSPAGAETTVRTRNSDGSVSSTHRPEEYGGLAPGVSTPSWIAREVAHANGRAVIAWPGFQMTPSGSRVFLAVTSGATVTRDPSSTPGSIHYRIANAVVPLRNNRRPLVTTSYDSPVARITLRNVGHDAELVLDVSGGMEPSLSSQPASTGLGYLYFDFGTYTRPAAETGIRATQRTGSGAGTITPSAAPRGVESDDERPPPVVR